MPGVGLETTAIPFPRELSHESAWRIWCSSRIRTLPQQLPEPRATNGENDKGRQNSNEPVPLLQSRSGALWGYVGAAGNRRCVLSFGDSAHWLCPRSERHGFDVSRHRYDSQMLPVRICSAR